MLQCRLNQRLRSRAAVFLQKFSTQRARVHADSYRDFRRPRRFYDFANVSRAADVAGIQSQCRHALSNRFKREFVIKMNVGDNRHVDGRDNRTQVFRGVEIGHGNSDDIATRLRKLFDLRDGRARVVSLRVRHRLNAYR